MIPNTVMGIPERRFCGIWISKLWQAMAKTGNGFRKHSLRNTGRGKDRRADKFEYTKLERRLALPTQTA